MPALRSLWSEQPVLARAFVALGVYNAILGVALIVGGYPRVQSPAFTLIRDLGGPHAWGSIFLVVGIAIAIAGTVGEKAVGLVCVAGAVAHAYFATQFLVVAVIDMRAALTGPPTYLLVAWWHLSVAIAYWAGHVPRGGTTRT